MKKWVLVAITAITTIFSSVAVWYQYGGQKCQSLYVYDSASGIELAEFTGSIRVHYFRGKATIIVDGERYKFEDVLLSQSKIEDFKRDSGFWSELVYSSGM